LSENQSTIGVVRPVHVRTPELLEATYNAIASLQSQHLIRLVVLVNRMLPGVRVRYDPEDESTKDSFEYQCSVRLRGGSNSVQVVDDHERCVAGTWNEGIRQLLNPVVSPEPEFILIINNDVLLAPDTIDQMVEAGRWFREFMPEISVWSAVNTRDVAVRDDVTYVNHQDGVDFSCFMVRPDFVVRHGEFDENFIPAYYEDNDIYARIVLGGYRAVNLPGVGYYHFGSLTIRSDNAAGAGNRRTFGLNKDYFARKWGVPEPKNSNAEILASYYKRPFGSPLHALSYWPTPERAGDFW
jgi:GT2 family glycosyltransferase